VPFTVAEPTKLKDGRSGNAWFAMPGDPLEELRKLRNRIRRLLETAEGSSDVIPAEVEQG
jgi:hypothetical protein